MWELGRAELHFFLWVIISSCRNYRCHRRLPHHFTPLFHRHTCSAPDVSSGLFSLGGKKTTLLSYCLCQQGAVPLELWTHFISNKSLALEYFTVQLLVRLCHPCALSTKMQLPIYFSLSLFCLFSASPVHLGSTSSNSYSRSFQEIYNFKRWLLKVFLNAYDQIHQLLLLGHHILEISTKPFNAH